MLTMTQAYESAQALLAETKDENGNIIAFHNVAFVSEVIYKLSTSKKATHNELGATLKKSLENYFAN